MSPAKPPVTPLSLLVTYLSYGLGILFALTILVSGVSGVSAETIPPTPYWNLLAKLHKVYFFIGESILILSILGLLYSIFPELIATRSHLKLSYFINFVLFSISVLLFALSYVFFLNLLQITGSRSTYSLILYLLGTRGIKFTIFLFLISHFFSLFFSYFSLTILVIPYFPYRSRIYGFLIGFPPLWLWIFLFALCMHFAQLAWVHLGFYKLADGVTVDPILLIFGSFELSSLLVLEYIFVTRFYAPIFSWIRNFWNYLRVLGVYNQTRFFLFCLMIFFSIFFLIFSIVPGR